MRRFVVLLPICLLIAAEPAKVDAKKEMEKLQGEWSMVLGERNGQELPYEFVKGGKRIAKGDETTVEFAGERFMKAKFTIDPSKKPKQIDYKILEGRNADKTALGIYEFDGENLKFCFAAAGSDRPTEFRAKEGTDHILSVWKKAKK